MCCDCGPRGDLNISLVDHKEGLFRGFKSLFLFEEILRMVSRSFHVLVRAILGSLVSGCLKVAIHLLEGHRGILRRYSFGLSVEFFSVLRGHFGVSGFF